MKNNKLRKNLQISNSIFEWIKNKKKITDKLKQNEYVKQLVIDIMNFDIFIKKEFNHKFIFQIFRNDFEKEYKNLKLPESMASLYEVHKEYLINDKHQKVKLCYFDPEDFKKYINTALLHICVWGKYKDTIEKYNIKYEEVINENLIENEYIYTKKQYTNTRQDIFMLYNIFEKTKEYEKTMEIKHLYINFICSVMYEQISKQKMIKLLQNTAYKKDYHSIIYNKKLQEIVNYMIRNNIKYDKSVIIQNYYNEFTKK
jgi:hypothetical protein